MTKLTCSGCGRTVDVDKAFGNEVCKKCSKPMKKDAIETTAKEVDEKSGDGKKIDLPNGEDLCGEMPNFSDTEIL